MKRIVRIWASLWMPLYYTGLGAGIILSFVWFCNWQYAPRILQAAGAILFCMFIGAIIHTAAVKCIRARKGEPEEPYHGW